ncbi:intersectin-1 isoform X7 [Brachionus plicatilis]|uniref:Intersectin-1 isoform X7 n=1 Tax=Brachionus plicatilis TaxID=10195 RepID=A0A3M7SQY1_BRAPC|nr:intersectin-1 isoform X7 [Brachionus plicatilis]
MDNPETWKITAEERTKHNTTFSQLNPLNGTMLSGEQVKPFFLKSGLPTPVLGQIWNLADLNKDGCLDRKEFSIACFLIKKVLTSQQGPAILPVTCPKSLQVDPVSVAPSSIIANTPLIASSSNPNNKPQASSTPIFSNNFPQANQIPISGISSAPPVASAPNMTMPMITPTPGLPSFPTNFVSPPPSTNIAASVASQPLTAGAIFTPLAAVNTNLPNPLIPIPSTSRTKYGQMFQSNDIGSTGFLTGQQAKTILMQNLADHDKDGKLSYEEFIVAMHLCDYAKTGSILPSTLPVELQPQRSRSSSAVLNTTLSPEPLNKSGSESSPVMANKLMAASFEDKRRENYDRGNAILEAKRQALREQEEREKREREEKERIEAERRQKLKEEQERRRLADMEKQMERQRLMDMQREEERRKAIEQRERARNELIKQQRIEWEKQKKQELETQKIKLQEQLSIAKAKDKNLEFDMQALNDKISSYKTKISDNQTSLIDLNNRLDSTRKINSEKHAQMEAAEREMKDFSQKLARLAQEKYHLNEELKNLKQDSLANEDLVEQNNHLREKEQSVNQLKQELSKLENQISSARTQLEVVKHELEVTKSDEIELVKENERLSKIIELKKNSLASVANTAKLNGSLSNSLNKSNNSNSSKPVNTSISKASQLDDNSRSTTPKNNYDAIKDEIFKIQQTTSSKQEGFFDPFSPGPTVKSSKPESSIKTDSNFNVDWTSAFDHHNETNSGFGVDNDPFTSLNTKQNEKVDPFAAFSSQKTNISFEDVWSNAPKPQSNLESVFGEIPKSTSNNTGFGLDDNWAANLASQTSPTKTTNLNTNTADWAAFPDESSKSSIKNTINFFNDNLKMQSPSIPSHSAAKPNKTNLHSPTANWVKFKALYTFEASQDDELSITEGDVLNVDLNFRADDGWLFGEFKGKSGIFPASFTIKLSDLEAIQEESLAPQPAFPIASNNFAQLAPQINPDKLVTDIKNYFISVYAYISNEPGDLNFRDFEVINVISRNEDWLTGQIVGSGIDPSNPLRSGIFPANFVVKFNLPVDYIGKYTISMATEPYVAQNSGELSLDPSSNQLIAIKKISPDAKWSFGETFDNNNQIHRGWFPIAAATSLINAGAPPVYSPAKAESVAQNYSNNSINNELRGANDSSFNQSPPPPQTQKALFPGLQNNDTFKNLEPRKSVNSATTSPVNSGQTESVVAPKPAVDETKVEPQTVSASELPNVIIDRVVALYDFAPQTPEAIGFPKDAIINILEKSGDWWLGEYNGKIGILPYNYVQSMSQKTVTKRENTSILTNRSVSLQNLSNRQSFPRRSGIQSATYENTDQLEDINAYLIVENYKNPLDQKKLLPLIELDTLFLNIEDIISFFVTAD